LFNILTLDTVGSEIADSLFDVRAIGNKAFEHYLDANAFTKMKTMNNEQTK